MSDEKFRAVEIVSKRVYRLGLEKGITPEGTAEIRRACECAKPIYLHRVVDLLDYRKPQKLKKI